MDTYDRIITHDILRLTTYLSTFTLYSLLFSSLSFSPVYLLLPHLHSSAFPQVYDSFRCLSAARKACPQPYDIIIDMHPLHRFSCTTLSLIFITAIAKVGASASRLSALKQAISRPTLPNKALVISGQRLIPSFTILLH